MLPKNGNFSGPGMLSICWTKKERSRLQYQTIRATKKNKRRFNMSNAINVKFGTIRASIQRIPRIPPIQRSLTGTGEDYGQLTKTKARNLKWSPKLSGECPPRKKMFFYLYNLKSGKKIVAFVANVNKAIYWMKKKTCISIQIIYFQSNKSKLLTCRETCLKCHM